MMQRGRKVAIAFAVVVAALVAWLLLHVSSSVGVDASEAQMHDAATAVADVAARANIGSDSLRIDAPVLDDVTRPGAGAGPARR